MKRLRFFRVLLPILLVSFLVLCGLEIRRRTKPWSPPGDMVTGRARAEGIRITDIEGSGEDAGLRFDISAQRYSGDEQKGWLDFEGVERLEIGRKDAPPLIISAARAKVDGDRGRRILLVEGGIVIKDDDAGLLLQLPSLEVDEADGVARSKGEVRFEAPGYQGRADRLMYGLEGKPTVLVGFSMVGDEGWTLDARRAELRDGADEIDLEGDVSLHDESERIECSRMLFLRGETGRLVSVVATGDVSGSGAQPGKEISTFSAEIAEIGWDDQGRKTMLALSGGAEVHNGEQGLAASVIRADRRSDPESGWDLKARENVLFLGVIKEQPAEMRAESLDLWMNGEGQVANGLAQGGVRFINGSTSTEAEQALLSRVDHGLQAELRSGQRLRASLANERRRVIADTITTRPGTSYLKASGKVEATLLQERAGQGPSALSGFFSNTEAIHFVSREMETSQDGGMLTFTGTVRGWQGERNLSADRVVVHLGSNSLEASGNVTTRFPRVEREAVSQADYIQVSSRELMYSGDTRQAAFSGGVQVRQAEGWMESDMLNVDLPGVGGGVKLIRALQNVRIEYKAQDAAGMPQPVNGKADRAEYTPSNALVRLFGDETSASVSHSGEGRVKTEGRVLRYWLDTGTLEVESRGPGRAKIRTSDP